MFFFLPLITVLIVLIPYFLNIILLIPLHLISLITTTNTYTCTLHMHFIISTLLSSIAAILVPITVHIAYLFLTVHIYLFIHLLHFTYAHTLHFLLFCTSGWMLNCISLSQYLYSVQ